MLDEAFSELMESEVLRVSKLGGNAAQSTNKRAIGELSKALDAGAAADPFFAKAISKLRGMMRYLRAKYGEVFNRAVGIQKAIQRGDINEGEYHALLDKLAGRDDVTTANAEAVIVASEIIDGVERVTFEDGSEMDVPFSIAPAGLGTRAITAAPDVVKIDVDPFSQIAEGAPRNEYNKAWKAWEKNNRDQWRQRVKSLDIRITNATAEEAQRMAKGEDARLHFQAVTMLPSLLENSVLAAVHKDVKERENIAEVHRRYAWAKFPDGITRNVLLTVYRWDEATGLDADTAYSEEVIMEIQEDPDARDTDVQGESQTASPTSNWAGDTLAQFLAGVKKEHRHTENSDTAYSVKKDIDKNLRVKPTSKQGASHADQLTALQQLAAKLATDPKRKRAIMERAASNLAKQRRDVARTVRAFGKDVETKVLSEERDRKNIQREAKMRQAMRREELEDEAYAKHQGILGNDDLTKLKSQPIHSVIADPTNPLKGRIRSRSATAKMQSDMLRDINLAEYDGADGLNKSIFGGTNSPDQMAAELFEMGLIRDASPDTMWNAIRKEQESVERMKELKRKAQAEVSQARVTARKEAKAWQEAELKKQSLDHSLHAKIVRAFGMLDGILYALPKALPAVVTDSC
jgi:hypothetical protein